MEGLAASVLLIAILLGVLLVVGRIVYLLAQRLPKRSPEPRKPVNRWVVVGLSQPQTPSRSLLYS
jgi:hypothetical protein